MKPESLKELITAHIHDAVSGEDELATPYALIISKDRIHGVCQLLHQHEKSYFDQLSCLSGLDKGAEEGEMEVIYNLYSIPYNNHLMLKVVIDRDQPSIDSVADIWKAADWHEREAFDLFGIHFENHPDLRRILLPDDWKGFPMRKDYVEQEKYHDVKVKY